jgi:hypothetical protein
MRGITFYNDKATNLKRLEALDREVDERLERAIFRANPDDELIETIFNKLSRHKELELWIEIPNGEPCFDLSRLPPLHNIRKLILRSGWTAASLSVLSEKIEGLKSLDMEPGLNKKLSLEPIKLLEKLKRLQIEKMSLDIEVINKLKLDYLYLGGMRKSSSELTPLCDDIDFGACSEEFIGSFKADKIERVSLTSSRSIFSLSPLNGLGPIKFLSLYELHSIESLGGLKYCGDVENLHIQGMKKLKLDESIGQYTKLRFLKIVGDNAVSKSQLGFLNSLSRLKYGQIIIHENGKSDYEAFPLVKLDWEKEKALFHFGDLNL